MCFRNCFFCVGNVVFSFLEFKRYGSIRCCFVKVSFFWNRIVFFLRKVFYLIDYLRFYICYEMFRKLVCRNNSLKDFYVVR